MLYLGLGLALLVYGLIGRSVCAEGDMRVRETGATLARNRLLYLEGLQLIRLPHWRWTCCEHMSRETMLFKHIGNVVSGDYMRYHRDTKARMRNRKAREAIADGSAAEKARRKKRLSREKKERAEKRAEDAAAALAAERVRARRARAAGAAA